jgi:uncharacterized DUF497 family protein
VGDTTEHGEFRSLPYVELVTHPREEVSQAIVSTFDSLWYPGTPARKRQSRNAIRAENDFWICVFHRVLGEENIRIASARSSNNGAIRVKF